MCMKVNNIFCASKKIRFTDRFRTVVLALENFISRYKPKVLYKIKKKKRESKYFPIKVACS